MLDKIRQYNIDLYITVKDEMKNLYVAEPFKYHADYHSFQLKFNFEDWSGIIDDGKEHISIVAEYVNARNGVLVKFQSEDFDELLKKVSDWNKNHKIN